MSINQHEQFLLTDNRINGTFKKNVFLFGTYLSALDLMWHLYSYGLITVLNSFEKYVTLLCFHCQTKYILKQNILFCFVIRVAPKLFVHTLTVFPNVIHVNKTPKNLSNLLW